MIKLAVIVAGQLLMSREASVIVLFTAQVSQYRFSSEHKENRSLIDVSAVRLLSRWTKDLQPQYQSCSDDERLAISLPPISMVDYLLNRCVVRRA